MPCARRLPLRAVLYQNQILPLMAMVASSEKSDDSPKLSRSQRLRRALLDVTSSEYDVLALSTAFKLLLFPT